MHLVAFPLKEELSAIVQSSRHALPELDAIGAHLKPAPVGWARDLLPGEALFDGAQTLEKLGSAPNPLTLTRCPGSELALPWPGREIGLAHLTADFLYRTRDRDLSGDVREMKKEAGCRIRGKVSPLAALVVREELDVSTCSTSKEDRARPGRSVFAHSRERHCFRVRRTRRGPFGLPSLKNVEGIYDR